VLEVSDAGGKTGEFFHTAHLISENEMSAYQP